MKKTIFSSIIMTIGFLLIVIVYGNLKNIFFTSTLQSSSELGSQQVVLAILGESLRAYLTIWLYQHHKADKSLISNAIKFGMVCSLLIGSIWLIIGVEFLDHQNKLSFIVDDGIILTFQGLISGCILWYFYKDESHLED